MATQNKTPQNLSPDLKQIYDRVMNTPASGGSPTPITPQQPETPKTPTPTPPPLPQKPAVASPSTPPASQNPVVPPQPPVTEPSEGFLTSTPPRPIDNPIGVKSFALGKDEKKEAPAEKTGEKKGLSKSLIIILAIVFFAAWSFFWFVFFFQPFS